MSSYITESESPFSEEEEQELAAELLELTSDPELDHFIGAVFQQAASAAGGDLPSPTARALGGWAKGAVHQILPAAGRALDSRFDAAASGPAPLAAEAGRLLGLENQGLSGQEQQLNAATQLVRLAGTAAAEAAINNTGGPPEDIARQAMMQAAQLHTPGLLRSAPKPGHLGGCGCGGGETCSCQPAAAGSWERRGRHIILYGT